MRGAASLALVAALAGCQAADTGANDTATAPVAASPAATSASTADLGRYVGKYPSDVLGGRTFMTEPAVRAVVEKASADPAIRGFVLEGKGPESPITRLDGKVTAWGCEQHNCGDHNWTVQVAPDGSAGGLCIEDASKGQATWYADGKPERRVESCPEAG